MQVRREIDQCTKLPSPLLTVYLNTIENDPGRHLERRSDLVWLERTAANMIRQLPYRDAKQFHRQVDRVVSFLQKRRPAEKALILFAGPRVWKAISLESTVKNDIAWGKPKIDQLFPLLEGHRSYGLVVIDHNGARYFSFSSGALRLLGEKQFEIDPSQWKRKDQGRIGSEGMQKARGPQRDSYDHRVAAQYSRTCGQIAQEVATLAEGHGFSGIFLAGPDRLIEVVHSKLPRRFAEASVFVRENLGRSSVTSLLRHLRPVIESYDLEKQVANVKLLLSADHGSIVSRDEVIAELQNGRLHTIFIAEGFELAMRKCPKCGAASASADRTCTKCGETRELTTFTKLLPDVLSRNDTRVEFLSGPAAELLGRSGGLGGWLRPARSAIAS